MYFLRIPFVLGSIIASLSDCFVPLLNMNSKLATLVAVGQAHRVLLALHGPIWESKAVA